MLVFTSFKMYSSDAGWFFINNVNLIFHEAGHVLFFIFGNFISVLGGTLGEILIPTIVTLHFLLKQQPYSAGFGLWWLSTAFWSVSIYAADARAQQLPLITGNSEDHDWTYLLRELGILEHDQIVGNIFLFCSFLALALAGMLFFRSIQVGLSEIKNI